jgi:hypothetical protein
MQVGQTAFVAHHNGNGMISVALPPAQQPDSSGRRRRNEGGYERTITDMHHKKDTQSSHKRNCHAR